MKLLTTLSLALIPFVSSSAASAPTPGAPSERPATGLWVIGGYTCQERSLELVAGQEARILLRGYGGASLEATLWGEDGVRIDRKQDATGRFAFQVTPARTGRYLVRIENLGERASSYTLRVE